MQVFCFHLIPHTIVITNLWGDGEGEGVQNLARGVKIFQLPLLYFTPLVTNIGESLSHATPATTVAMATLLKFLGLKVCGCSTAKTPARIFTKFSGYVYPQKF